MDDAIEQLAEQVCEQHRADIEFWDSYDGE